MNPKTMKILRLALDAGVEGTSDHAGEGVTPHAHPESLERFSLLPSADPFVYGQSGQLFENSTNTRK